LARLEEADGHGLLDLGLDPILDAGKAPGEGPGAEAVPRK
jgi:hypothetical protein